MNKEKPILIGHTIYLRNPLDEDVKEGNWHDWYNDMQITKYNRHGVFPITRENELEYINNNKNKKSNITLAIIEKNGDRLVGNISLYNIDLINRNCNLGLTIGEKSSISTGVEAFGLMADHAFNRLNLNRIEEGTHEKLEIFVKMLKSIGFKKDGVAKEYFLRNGVFSDKIMYSLLCRDFQKLKKDRQGAILFRKYDELLKEIRKCCE